MRRLTLHLVGNQARTTLDGTRDAPPGWLAHQKQGLLVRRVYHSKGHREKIGLDGTRGVPPGWLAHQKSDFLSPLTPKHFFL